MPRLALAALAYAAAAWICSRGPTIHRFAERAGGGAPALVIVVVFWVLVLGLLAFSVREWTQVRWPQEPRSSGSEFFARLARFLDGGASEVLWRWAAAFGLLALFYPGFLLFTAFPLAPKGWELQDPIISPLTLWPSLEAVRAQWFKEAGFWWTSLRGLGGPVLAQEVHAAPLFPLTLLLIAFPAKVFWNLFVSTRLLLLGFFSLGLGREVLRLTRAGSLVFTMAFVYGLNTVRFINHPWQNALLAGLALVFFANRLIAAPIMTGSPARGRARDRLGTIIAAYSAVTAGFPEGSLVAALLASAMGTGAFLDVWRVSRAGVLLRRIGLVAALTAAGVGLASFQLYALAEAVELSGEGYRGGIGLTQFPDAWSAFLGWLTAYSGSGPQNPWTAHRFGILALGLLVTAATGWRLGALPGVALVCAAFYVLKVFAIWPWFNHAVGSLPLLSQSWFTVYFFPLLLWPAAWWMASGFEQAIHVELSVARERSRTFVFAGIVAAIGILLAWGSARVTGQPLWVQAAALRLGQMPAAVVTAIGVLWVLPRLSRDHRKVVLLLALACETWLGDPREFNALPNDRDREYGWRQATAALDGWLTSGSYRSRHEVRVVTSAGAHVAAAIASPDAGFVPFLTSGARELRAELFTGGANALGPLVGPKSWDSWSQLSGTYHWASDPAARIPGCGDCVPVRDFGFAWLMEDRQALPRVFLATRSGDFVARKGVPILLDTGARLQLASVRGPGVLVMQDQFYPGWSAYNRLTLQDLPVRPFHAAFRAVELPEAHEYLIEMWYRPPWLDRALLITLVAFLVGFVLVVWVPSINAPNASGLRRAQRHGLSYNGEHGV